MTRLTSLWKKERLRLRSWRLSLSPVKTIPSLSQDKIFHNLAYFQSLDDTLVLGDTIYSKNWIRDSCASFHVMPHCGWLSTYNAGNYGCIKLRDFYACDIVGVEDIHFAFPDGSFFVLKGDTYTKSGEEFDLNGTACRRHGSFTFFTFAGISGSW